MVAKPKLELLPSYLKAIENSVNSNLFRSLYYRIDGEIIDVLYDGDLSCAIYVTTILFLFGLIKERHTTIKATLDDLIESGWYKIKRPRKGAVTIWDYRKKEDGTLGTHWHLGFYINKETAVSNVFSARIVQSHHPTFGKSENGKPQRKILTYYWNKKLN